MEFSTGKIYKLISNQTDLIYIGSTCKSLNQRLSKHKGNYKCWLNEKYCYVSSFEIIKLNDAEIILIEDFPCNSGKELREREQFWINSFSNTINKNLAYTPLSLKEYKNEHYLSNKERYSELNKKWVNENHEKQLIYWKDYYNKNKEVKKEQGKIYRLTLDKNKCNEYQKKYYKEKLSVKINCECGSIITQRSIKRHNLTKKHMNYIKKKKGDNVIQELV